MKCSKKCRGVQLPKKEKLKQVNAQKLMCVCFCRSSVLSFHFYMYSIFLCVGMLYHFVAKDAYRLLVEKIWDGMEWRAQNAVALWILTLKNLIGWN